MTGARPKNNENVPLTVPQRTLARPIACTVLALLMLAAAAGAWGQQGESKRQRAWNLVREAQELIAAGRTNEALERLEDAAATDPTYVEVHANFAYLFTLTGERDKALRAAENVLLLRPDHAYGRQVIKTIYYEGEFPRTIPFTSLAFSPVSFATDETLISGPDGLVRHRIAYTTSMLFHEQMDRASGPVKISIPVAAHNLHTLVNRSVYGFAIPPGGDDLHLRFLLSYPSATITVEGNDYSTEARQITHLLLRFYWYAREYLGYDLPGTGHCTVYMSEMGPAGAEAYNNSLYFYDIKEQRSPVEWARQTAHEYGHLILPPVGRYLAPEPFAAGFLGERLFLQYLAYEAGLVSGSPWPSKAARDAVNGLWPGQDFDLASYIEKFCRPSLDYWLAQGPESPLISGTGEDAMQYFIGFILWVQATHGSETTGTVLREAIGTMPVDFVEAYKKAARQMATEGGMTVHARALNPAAGKMATPPLEGAMGRIEVKLGAQDSAVYTVYLAEGSWRVRLAPHLPGSALTFDGKGPFPIDPQDGCSLGRVAEGWYTLKLHGPAEGQALPIEQIILQRQRET